MNTVPYTFKMDHLSRQDICLEFFSACYSKNTDSLMQLCTGDSQVNFMSLGEEGRGPITVVGKQVWLRLIKCLVDLEYTLKDVGINSNGSITCQVQMWGNRVRNVEGVAGRSYSVKSEQIFIFHFDQQDKIIRIFIYWDHEKLKCQLKGAPGSFYRECI